VYLIDSSLGTVAADQDQAAMSSREELPTACQSADDDGSIVTAVYSSVRTSTAQACSRSPLGPFRRQLLAVDLSTVPDPQHKDNHTLVENLVEDTVVSDAEAVDARYACQCLDAWRARGVLQSKKSSVKPPLNVLWKREECPLRRALEQNLV